MSKTNLYSRWIIPGLIISTGLGILLLALLVASPAGQAEAAPGATTYAVTWYTADNGGGISSGGSYEVVGTVGQMDAASGTAGGVHGLESGFWTAFIDLLNEVFLPAVLK
jgi:hypothetical protein